GVSRESDGSQGLEASAEPRGAGVASAPHLRGESSGPGAPSAVQVRGEASRIAPRDGGETGETRAGLAGGLREGGREGGAQARGGCVRLWVTLGALGRRRRHPALFADGEYCPLLGAGAGADHVFAFARTLGDRRVIVAVPRLVVRLTGGTPRPPIGAEIW